MDPKPQVIFHLRELAKVGTGRKKKQEEAGVDGSFNGTQNQLRKRVLVIQSDLFGMVK